MGKTRPKLNTRRTTVWLDAAQLAALKRITEQTGAPAAFLIRQGVDWVIAQHGVHLARAQRAKGRAK